MNIFALFAAYLLFFLAECDAALKRDLFGRSSFSKNGEINSAVLRLEKNMRVLENKLSRHEFREAQVADYSTKTLSALTSDHALNLKNLRTIVKQIVSLEERVISLEELIKTTDERQSKKLENLSDGLNRLLSEKPGFDASSPPGSLSPILAQEIEKLLKKFSSVDNYLKEAHVDIKKQVTEFGEKVIKEIKTIKDHKGLAEEKSACEKYTFESIVQNFSDAGLKKQEEILEKFSHVDTFQNKMITLNENTLQNVKEQREDLKSILIKSEKENVLMKKHFSLLLDSLKSFENVSNLHLDTLGTVVGELIEKNGKDVKSKIDRLQSSMNETSSVILNTLDDSVSGMENIQNGLTEKFADLTQNIRGLKKVEQVMLSTADAVLDTKRSIEFGIQQVILELSATVKNSGRNIDSTISNHINNISFAILKNQTVALTNMTRKMEDEISQVWRQIGIMYQQITHSVDILGDIQSSTNKQMNDSFNKVDDMDGTVGAITNKVNDVEDNLNYLLGRLSLVVSEFSHMKIGVGSELEKLREMAKQFSDNKVVEYQVNRKRST